MVVDSEELRKRFGARRLHVQIERVGDGQERRILVQDRIMASVVNLSVNEARKLAAALLYATEIEFPEGGAK
jgi:hypothetical protein